MGLNVVDARLITSANGFSLETYVVLEDNGAVIAETARIREIERGLWRNLQQAEDSPAAVTRRAPRQVRMFSTPTQVNFSVDSRNDRTILELIAADRPGLLSEVGKVFKRRARRDQWRQDHDGGRARGGRVLHHRRWTAACSRKRPASACRKR